MCRREKTEVTRGGFRGRGTGRRYFPKQQSFSNKPFLSLHELPNMSVIIKIRLKKLHRRLIQFFGVYPELKGNKFIPFSCI